MVNSTYINIERTRKLEFINFIWDFVIKISPYTSYIHNKIKSEFNSTRSDDQISHLRKRNECKDAYSCGCK